MKVKLSQIRDNPERGTDFDNEQIKRLEKTSTPIAPFLQLNTQSITK